MMIDQIIKEHETQAYNRRDRMFEDAFRKYTWVDCISVFSSVRIMSFTPTSFRTSVNEDSKFGTRLVAVSHTAYGVVSMITHDGDHFKRGCVDCLLIIHEGLSYLLHRGNGHEFSYIAATNAATHFSDFVHQFIRQYNATNN